MSEKQIILFDGVCNLCNGSVQFIMKRDKDRNFLYAPLQGETAKIRLENSRFSSSILESILLVDGEKIYDRSTAALKIAKQLNGAWPMLYVYIIIPKFIRDGVYNFIGKNRYKWFGKQESCMMPTPEIKALFLD